MNMFEELVKRFHIKYGKLQISGFHGLPADPRKNNMMPHYASLPLLQQANFNVPSQTVLDAQYEGPTQPVVVAQNDD